MDAIALRDVNRDTYHAVARGQCPVILDGAPRRLQVKDMYNLRRAWATGYWRHYGPDGRWPAEDPRNDTSDDWTAYYLWCCVEARAQVVIDYPHVCCHWPVWRALAPRTVAILKALAASCGPECVLEFREPSALRFGPITEGEGRPLHARNFVEATAQVISGLLEMEDISWRWEQEDPTATPR